MSKEKFSEEGKHPVEKRGEEELAMLQRGIRHTPEALEQIAAEGASPNKDKELLIDNIQRIEDEFREVELLGLTPDQRKFFEKLEIEFTRQVDTLIETGYHEAAGITEDELKRKLQFIRTSLIELAKHRREIKPSHIPFVLVISPNLIPLERQYMRTIMGHDRKKFRNFPEPDVTLGEYESGKIHKLGGRKPPKGIVVPSGDAYIITDIEDGHATTNLSIVAAENAIHEQGRSALLPAEGLALITHYPKILQKLGELRLKSSFLQPTLVFGKAVAIRPDNRNRPYISSGRGYTSYHFRTFASSTRGTPSCKTRLGAPSAKVRKKKNKF